MRLTAAESGAVTGNRAAAARALGEALEAIGSLEILEQLPDGIGIADSGEAEGMDEMFEQFGLAMACGILVVALILVLLFGDFLQPLTILLALPLSVGGAAAGLLAWGAALDMSSVIGILMLMGIVTKNSILLVDFVVEKRRRGMNRAQALIRSGDERVRPIIMTTVAMTAGMAPTLFATGAGAAFRTPMAVSVIAGLLVSTALSLILVPVMYLMMDDVRQWLSARLLRMTTVTEQDRQEAERKYRSGWA